MYIIVYIYIDINSYEVFVNDDPISGMLARPWALKSLTFFQVINRTRKTKIVVGAWQTEHEETP